MIASNDERAGAAAPTWVTHVAWTETRPDSRVGAVRLGLAGHPLRFGGESHASCPRPDAGPSEVLCAALAASVDETIRTAAARLGVEVENLAVLVTGDVDSRSGRRDGRVGFDSMRVHILLRLGAGATSSIAALVLATAEREAVVLRTLQRCMPIAWITEDA